MKTTSFSTSQGLYKFLCQKISLVFLNIIFIGMMVVNAQTIPLGSELTVSNTSQNVLNNSVAMDSDGNFVVTFEGSDGDGNGVYARRYNASGNPLGNEFLVNTITTSNQSESAVAMSNYGDFVVVWTTFVGTNKEIHARRYSAAGIALGDEFMVNPSAVTQNSKPSVTMDAVGNFVIAWMSSMFNKSIVYVQSYNTAGATTSNYINIGSVFSSYNRTNPSVAMNNNGGFIITYTLDDNLSIDITAMGFTASGAQLMGETRVNSTITGNQDLSTIAMDNDGNFVVSWFDGQDIYARRYNASRIAQGLDFLVNTVTAGTQTNPVVSIDDAGNFVIGWEGPDGSGNGIFARRYNFSGIPESAEFRVNSSIAGIQRNTSLDMNSEGKFIVGWTGITTREIAYLRRYEYFVNSAPVISPQTFSVSEGSTNGTFVGIVTASDANVGQTLYYNIVNGNEDGKFSINSTNGVILVSGSLDFETTPLYTLTVQVTDNAPVPSSVSSAVTIQLTDVTEAVPSAPSVVSPLSVCAGGTAPVLQATGTNLKWYTSSTGGTASTTAPILTASAVGTTSYFVSQTIDGTESARAEIVFTVNAIPSAPVVSSPISYCEGSVATSLSATGNNLMWYMVPSEGTGISAAPTPSAAIAGNTIYYVSQSLNGCESGRSAIEVVIKPMPSLPVISATTITYCQGATTTALSATGTNLTWYVNPVGGTGNAVAPVPSSAVAGTNLYYVTQTIDGCESARNVVAVIVSSSPSAPQVNPSVEYCQYTQSSPLTAGGVNLLWYTTSSGGTASLETPVPATSLIGTTRYYVSQSFNGCESGRSEISVTITSAPSAPSAVASVNYCVGSVAAPLAATGTNLQWYSAANACTAGTISPVPSTALVGTTSYYVSQLINGCESPKTEIKVVVNQTAPTPAVVSPVTYFVNAVSSALTASGTNLLWYTSATGGIGNASAPIPSTSAAGTFNYYVSQNLGGCESPRALIQVKVLAGDINVPSCFAKGGSYVVELNPSYTNNATSYSWWVNGAVQSISPTNTSLPRTTITVGQWYTGGQVCAGINYNQSPWYRKVCVTVDLCQSGAKITDAPASSVMEDNKELVKLFPNPSTEEVVVQVSSPISEVEIKNTLGVTVYSTKEISSTKTIVWDASIAAGMYILQYRTEDGVQHQKALQKQ